MQGFFMGVVVTAVVMLLALNVHCIKHDEGFSFHQKEQMTFELTYADVKSLDAVGFMKLSKSARDEISKRKVGQFKKKVGEGLDKLKEAINGE